MRVLRVIMKLSSYYNKFDVNMFMHKWGLKFRLTAQHFSIVTQNC